MVFHSKLLVYQRVLDHYLQPAPHSSCLICWFQGTNLCRWCAAHANDPRHTRCLEGIDILKDTTGHPTSWCFSHVTESLDYVGLQLNAQKVDVEHTKVQRLSVQITSSQTIPGLQCKTWHAFHSWCARLRCWKTSHLGKLQSYNPQRLKKSLKTSATIKWYNYTHTYMWTCLCIVYDYD